MTGITNPAEEYFKDGFWGWDSDAGAWIKVTAEDGKLKVSSVPELHAVTHENSGDDEINVAGLSGELADDQPPKAHLLAGTAHTADTLADLNTLVSDATLDDSGDPRTPDAHKASHQNGGGDEVDVAGLSGELADDQPPKPHASDHTSATDPLYSVHGFVWTVAGTLSTGANASFRLRAKQAITFLEAELLVKTAPTGAALIVDINLNGTTLFTTQANRPEIAISATEGESTTFNVETGADDDVFTIDVDQVGSTVAGADLTVILWFKTPLV